jgi:hypothetical protein
MKFLRVREKEPNLRWFVFQLDKQEVDCLKMALAHYPMLDVYSQPLSRQGGANEDQQRLLDEVTRGWRAERRKQVLAFLSHSKYFRWESPGHYRLTVTPEEAEWLLQVLNDIRVGCWSHLGGLELEELEKSKLDDDQCRERAIMDLCGYFEMGLLEAFKSA